MECTWYLKHGEISINPVTQLEDLEEVEEDLIFNYAWLFAAF